jgi:hypothetical protein
VTTTKLRAKIRHNGKDIHLGYFSTKAQVNAACVAGHAALSRLDQINGVHHCPPQRLPSPKRLIEIIEQGSYDVAIEEVAESAAARQRFAERFKNKPLFPIPESYKFNGRRLKPLTLAQQ